LGLRIRNLEKEEGKGKGGTYKDRRAKGPSLLLELVSPDAREKKRRKGMKEDREKEGNSSPSFRKWPTRKKKEKKKEKGKTIEHILTKHLLSHLVFFFFISLTCAAPRPRPERRKEKKKKGGEKKKWRNGKEISFIPSLPQVVLDTPTCRFGKG